MANQLLNAGTPTADLEGLTAGLAYGLAHTGAITAAVAVGASGTYTVIYTAPAAGFCYLPVMIGTVLRVTLQGNTAAAELTLTAAVNPT